MPFTHEHENPPRPFNPKFRPGFEKAIHESHLAWCDDNEGATRAERAQNYLDTAKRLESKYPVTKELFGT